LLRDWLANDTREEVQRMKMLLEAGDERPSIAAAARGAS